MQNIDKCKNDQLFLSDLSTITKGGGIIFGSTMAGKAIFLLYTVFLARFLGPEAVGLYFLGFTIITIVSALANLGLNVGTTRYVAIYNGRNERENIKATVFWGTTAAFSSGVIVAVIIYLLSNYAAQIVFHKPELGPVLQTLSYAIPFETAMKVLLGSTQGLKLLQYTAMIENMMWVITRFILTGLFIPILVSNIRAATWGYVVSSALCSFVTLYCTGRLIYPRSNSVTISGMNRFFVFHIKKCRNLLTQGLNTILMLLKFSIPFVWSSFLGNVSRQMDFLMIGMFASASDTGIYSVAVRLIVLAEFVFQIFIPVFQPFIAEFCDKNENWKLSRLVKTVTRWTVAFSLPIYIALFVFPEFFLYFFGNGFVAASMCLSILAIAHIISSPSTLPNIIIYMSGRSDVTAKNNTLLLIANIILNYFLIKKFGIIGAAISAGICFVGISTVRIVEVLTIIKIHPFSIDLLKPVGAISCSLLLVFAVSKIFTFTSQFHAAFGVSILFFFYICLIIFFKGNPEDYYIIDILKNKALSLLKY